MRVLAHIHRYPPLHNAGAEWALHHTLRYLLSRGHEVRVLSRDHATAEFEGVAVTARPNARTLDVWYRWADVVLTHLDVTATAVQHSIRHRKPLVHLVHNHRQLAHHRVTPQTSALAVFNSRWLRDEVAWPGPSMVLHPPVPPDYYAGPTGDRVLVSNLTPAKGARLVWEVARRTPDIPYLAVRGAYGWQAETPDLPNVEVVEPTPGLGPHLDRARLVLMPSAYESWGRVALEAACRGIPTVASRAAGLVESLRGSGCPHLDVAVDGIVESPPPWGAVSPTAETVDAWTAAVEHWYEVGPSQGMRDHAERVWATTVGQLDELDTRLRGL